MSDLYANPALRQSELNRQGSMAPLDPTKPEIMDSVFFNIENNTFKIWNSNRKGQGIDETAGSLMDPKDVWEQYGVKTEAPISSGNAERMRDNMDEVANRNYNLSFLEHTSMNQARTFLNGMAGPILTDPAQVLLSIASGGILSVVGKTLGRSAAIANVAKFATKTGFGRVASAAALGAAEGAIEGFIESEILLDQAPKAGLQFDDDDYWNNVRANVFFSSVVGSIRQGAGELRGLRDSKASVKNFVEAEANKIPRDVVIHRENYKDNSPSGRLYTTHFSNDGKYDFDTQTPISKSDFGKGYQFSTSREWAFSDKGLGLNRKESVFEFDADKLDVRLFDAENAIPMDIKRKMLDALQEDLGSLPKSVIKDIETGDVTVNELADILSTMDNKSGTTTLDKLAEIIKGEGFHGYSFSDGTLDPTTGKFNRGIHLFEMPEGASVNHLNPDGDIVPRSTNEAGNKAKQVEAQKALDYHAEKANDVNYNREYESELETTSVETTSDPLLEFNEEASSIKESNSILEEEVASLDVEKAVTIEPEKSREIAKATDFCVRN